MDGSLSKTAVNGSVGAGTEVPRLATARAHGGQAAVLGLEDQPEMTLSAVVIGTLIELVDYKALAALRQFRASDLLAQVYGARASADLIAAMLGVLTFDTPGRPAHRHRY
jgi:hypothetical protein